ncbi:peptidase M20 [archaeon SCG-AAA382B04]|nr:peptidase M20 [archaeon SCG-AAA382B04]
MFESNELVKKTKELVKIPSWEDEKEASKYVCDLVDGEIDEIGNVFASKGEGEKEIAFISHLDTVPPSNELEVYTENSRIFGRGAADMKGSLIAMALAFNKASPNQKLTFASFVGEETDARGVKHAVKNGFSPDYSIIGEGTANYSQKDKLDVCVAHRGRKEVEIETKGVSSHASQPEFGENAILEMFDVIKKIQNTEPPKEEVFGEEMKAGSCITQIESEGATNVVPDKCQITMDVRTIPNKNYDLEFGDKHRIVTDVLPMKTKNEELIKALERSVEKETGYSPNRIIKPQATDAGFLAENGSDTIILGPSEPTEPHSNNESVSIDILEDTYNVFLDLANNF